MNHSEDYNEDGTRIEGRQYEWIHVTLTKSLDKYYNHVYKTQFKSNHELEWHVKYRFKVYRELYNALKELEVTVDAPFPPTYLRSKFGIPLSEELLLHRTQLLSEWVLALFSLYGTLCPDARELLSIMFDASQAVTEPKCLRKIHSYLDYMSTAYQETHVREPSIDLVNRFKLDLERAASSPHSSERNLPAVGNGEGCSSSDRGVDRSLGIGCDSGNASRGIVGADTEGRDRSITGPPSLCSISELGPARSTIV